MPQYIICDDPDLQDVYLCKRMRLTHGRRDIGKNPIVQVLRILRYPIQHTVIYPDIPNENAPIPGETITRLRYVRDAMPEELTMWPDYQASLDAALSAAISSALGAEFTILVRHMAGEIKDRRTVLTYKAYETEDIP